MTQNFSNGTVFTERAMSKYIIKVDLKSILNYRTLLGFLKQSQVDIRPSRLRWTKWPCSCMRKGRNSMKENMTQYERGLLTVPCKLAQLCSRCLSALWSGSGSSLSDGATRLGREYLPPPEIQLSTSTSQWAFPSRVCCQPRGSRESPHLTRVVLSPESTSALTPVLHLEECDGFLQKTLLKSALFQFYTFDILMIKQNE